MSATNGLRNQTWRQNDRERRDLYLFLARTSFFYLLGEAMDVFPMPRIHLLTFFRNWDKTELLFLSLSLAWQASYYLPMLFGLPFGGSSSVKPIVNFRNGLKSRPRHFFGCRWSKATYYFLLESQKSINKIQFYWTAGRLQCSTSSYNMS